MEKVSKEQVEKAFAKADTDGTGKLTKEQFKSVMLAMTEDEKEKEEMKSQMTPEMLDMVLGMMDGDGDSLISLDEFLKMCDIGEGERPSDEEIFANMIRAGDKDKNGVLSAAELKPILGQIGMEGKEFDFFLAMADANGDKKLQIEEVINFISISQCTEKKDPKEEKRGMFRMCDTNGDGKVSKKELSSFFAMVGDDDEDDEDLKQMTRMMIAMGDEDGDGQLNYEEFCEMMD